MIVLLNILYYSFIINNNYKMLRENNIKATKTI